MKIDITAQRFTLNEDIKKYVTKKIGKLERMVPRHARKSVHAVVTLKENPKTKTDRFSCEVKIHLPNHELIVEEGTINMFAAVDIVEAKLKNQLTKYHDKHAKHRINRKAIMTKLRRLSETDFRNRQN